MFAWPPPWLASSRPFASATAAISIHSVTPPARRYGAERHRPPAVDQIGELVFGVQVFASRDPDIEFPCQQRIAFHVVRGSGSSYQNAPIF
jgi:hypothetical protein